MNQDLVETNDPFFIKLSPRSFQSIPDNYRGKGEQMSLIYPFRRW